MPSIKRNSRTNLILDREQKGDERGETKTGKGETGDRREGRRERNGEDVR